MSVNAGHAVQTSRLSVQVRKLWGADLPCAAAMAAMQGEAGHPELWFLY